MNGEQLYSLAEKLFPINRSVTGAGVRETLSVLKEIVPEMIIHEVPSGTRAYDWTIPDEWSITDAYIEDDQGNRIIDYRENNLYVMGYAAPIDRWVDLEDLDQYVYVDNKRPDAIPYVTSYYERKSGFCMEKSRYERLKKGKYHLFIDSAFDRNGSMTYAEVYIPSDVFRDNCQEVFFSSYICHPSMANNEISGPVVLTGLIETIKKTKNRRYGYRFLLAPETIGAIYYISENLYRMKENIICGFVISCVGDDRAYSYISSRRGDTLADRVALNVLQMEHPQYKRYSFLDRGSDERQYCSSGVDLPICTICRSKFAEYPEYHTSDDNLSIISGKGLAESLELLSRFVEVIENNDYYRMKCICEPQLGKRGLYPNTSTKEDWHYVKVLLDFIAYADGELDLIDISNEIHQPIHNILPVINQLFSHELVESREGKDVASILECPHCEMSESKQS